MDPMDKQILDIIQSGFPLTPRPYEAVGKQIGLTETETLARVRSLKERGIIRRLGASFQSKALGWRSTLCAAKVPEDKLDQFVSAVNKHPGVTHNYIRQHEYNVWFTYIGPSWDAVCAALDSITEETGVPILNMPAKKMFKIKVEFKMDDQNAPAQDEEAD